MEILKPGLVVVKDFFSNYDEILNYVYLSGEDPESKVRWERARVDKREREDQKPNRGKEVDHRTNSIVPIHPMFQDAENKSYNALGQIAVNTYNHLIPQIDHYKNLYPLSAATKTVPKSYNFLKYQLGQEYKIHDDFSVINKRAISFLVYINDDYEGGHLEFPYLGLKIKPEKNSLIIFPSNFLFGHIAHPVTSGTKYAVVNWIEWA